MAVTWAPGLPEGAQVSSASKRLVGHLLEALLVVCTLVVGWIVWSVVVWGRGQTPAKQLLGMTVISETTRRPVGRGRMFFREIVAKSLIGYLPFVVLLAAPKDRPGEALVYVVAALALSVITTFWILWDRRRQQLYDKLVGTLVVDDPFRRLSGSPVVGRSVYERSLDPPRARPVREPPLSAVSLDRAVDYFHIGKHEVALTLLRQGAQDASRRGDARALEHVLRLTAQARKILPGEFRFKLDEIERIARSPRRTRR